MIEVGEGLLNRTMLLSIEENGQRDGVVGLLYVKLHEAADCTVALHWETEQQQLFWRQQMDGELFYWFRCDSNADSMDTMLRQLGNQLRSRLRSGNAAARIGWAKVPIGAYHRTETLVFQAITEAILAAKSPDSSAVPLKEQNVIVRNGSIDPYLGQPFGIGQLAVPFPVFSSHTLVSEVADLFETNQRVQGAIIADDGSPVGLLMKEQLHQQLAGLFGLPLYWNRPVRKIMNMQPLIVEADMPVEQVSQLAMSRDNAQLYDIVIITQAGLVIGAASIRSILECMTALRTEVARAANPLTGLPGNVGIQLELQRRIRLGASFAVIYADLDYFKWFNDCFGFSQGDMLIRYLADVLREEKELSGSTGDFIGHIGGDDFIMVTEASYAERLCQHLIEKFDEGIKSFYGGVDVTAVEDRHGNRIEQKGVTLSLSLMISEYSSSLTPELISSLSARLKKQAKARSGSVYVMEKVVASHHGEERM